MSYERKSLAGTAAEYSIVGSVVRPATPPRNAISRAIRRLTLGDDMTEPQWRQAMLEQQKEVVQWQKRWVERDELQRWLQLGATLAIPLSAAVWKMIFRAGRNASKKE